VAESNLPFKKSIGGNKKHVWVQIPKWFFITAGNGRFGTGNWSGTMILLNKLRELDILYGWYLVHHFPFILLKGQMRTKQAQAGIEKIS